MFVSLHRATGKLEISDTNTEITTHFMAAFFDDAPILLPKSSTSRNQDSIPQNTNAEWGFVKA